MGCGVVVELVERLRADGRWRTCWLGEGTSAPGLKS